MVSSICNFHKIIGTYQPVQWRRSLRRRSAAACLLKIVGSNSTRIMDVCLLWVLCVFRYMSLRRASH